jgi:hypothetical protein
MTAWIKLGYFTESQEAAADYWLKRTWVSDSPGRDSPWWKTHPAPKKGQEYPFHGPQYKVGDRLVIYITKRLGMKGVCPAILEVTAAPRWDPDWVDAAHPGEGNTWGVVTDVKGLWSVALADAPDLETIGKPAASMNRKGHVSLEDWQYELAEAALRGQRTSARQRKVKKKPDSLEVPLQDGKVEGYDVMPKLSVTRAIRRETSLVSDYGVYLEAAGDEVSRNKLRPHGSSHPLWTDLFNKTRGQLIEAKAGTGRGDIRMAIGQLADYRRYVPEAKHCGVLLEAAPHPDLLAPLHSQKIAAIWRSGYGFADSAGGSFT